VTRGALLAGLAAVVSAAAIVLGPVTAYPSEPGAVAGVDFVTASRVVEPPMGQAAAARTRAARGGNARPARGGTAPVPGAGRFWELQLNLCNSGEAGCYSGGNAVYEGGDLIYHLRPNLVTLNEICADDLARYLLPSLSEAWPNDWVYSVFVPAVDKRTNAAYRCQNGFEFGNAVLGRVAAGSFQGVSAWGGRYGNQDRSTEDRTFACAYAVGDHLACATHLSSRSGTIALAQCRALLSEAIPHIRSEARVSGRTIIGGDLNMPFGRGNAQNCVPTGHTRKGDGDVQHVIFSNDTAFNGTASYPMTHTDHAAFLVKLTTL
jgi:hypothetical protein